MKQNQDKNVKTDVKQSKEKQEKLEKEKAEKESQEKEKIEKEKIEKEKTEKENKEKERLLIEKIEKEKHEKERKEKEEIEKLRRMKKRSQSQVKIKYKINKSKFEEFEELGNKPENYFDLNKNPIIGHSYVGPRFEDGKVVKHSVVVPSIYEEVKKQIKKIPEKQDDRTSLSKHNLFQSFTSNRNSVRSSSNFSEMRRTIAIKNTTNSLNSCYPAPREINQTNNFKYINHENLEQIYGQYQLYKAENGTKV